MAVNVESNKEEPCELCSHKPTESRPNLTIDFKRLKRGYNDSLMKVVVCQECMPKTDLNHER